MSCDSRLPKRPLLAVLLHDFDGTGCSLLHSENARCRNRKTERGCIVSAVARPKSVGERKREENNLPRRAASAKCVVVIHRL